MARSKSSLRIFAEYAAFLSANAVLRGAPRPLAVRAADGLLRLILLFMPRRRAMMRRHLEGIFPNKDRRATNRIARESLTNLARGIHAFTHLPDPPPGERFEDAPVDGLHHLEEALRKGRGVIAFTAHYGCWELMSVRMMALYPGRVAVVYRALDNPLIDAEVMRRRSAAGGRLIERHGLARQGLRWLKENRILGTLVDQNFPDGIFVPFLGRPAATVPIVSQLARRAGSVVLPVHNRWEGNRLRVIWEEPLLLSDRRDPAEAIAEDTSAMNRKIGEWIRRDPGQWLWLHNRWKTQPQPTDP